MLQKSETALELQIIIVPKLFIHLVSPAFVLKSPNCIRVRFIVVVETSEVVFVPLHRAIRSSTTFEIKTRPGFDSFRLTDDPGSIYFPN